MPAYRPLDRTLTQPIVEPVPPPKNCTYHGKPAWCVLDGLVWIEEWRGKVREANTDRATAAKTSAGPTP